MLPDYKAGLLFTPLRQRHLHLVMVQFTITDGSGTPSLDTAQSSPNVTVVRNTTGQYTLTFPKGLTAHYVSGEVMNAEAVGGAIYLESISAATGTATFETAVNTAAATAADPASGSRIFLTLLVGKI